MEQVKNKHFRRHFKTTAELLEDRHLLRKDKKLRAKKIVIQKRLFAKRLPYRHLTNDDKRRIIFLRYDSHHDFSQPARTYSDIAT